MPKRKVVVTGLGLVSPIGNTVSSAWDALLSGKSGIKLIDNFDTTSYTTHFAGIVKDFDIKDYSIKNVKIHKMDTFIQYGIAAAFQAIKDSNLVITKKNSHRIGVSIGSGIGGFQLIEKNCNILLKKGSHKISPFFIPSTLINMISGNLSIICKIQGPNICISTACASGIHNIGYAARIISYNDADVMIAGGSEKSSTPLVLGGFGAAKALSTRNDNPKLASRPWDKDRDGFVLGDGAGVMVLEEYEYAKKRKANIYAELSGFGTSSDAFHITLSSENGEGAARAMENALFDAKLSPSKITYINAHGTSTLAGDKSETQAIKSVFKENCKNIMVSSTKSMTGHMLGASGAAEAIFSVLSLYYQSIPPTINLDNPDQGCDLDYVPKESRHIKNMKYVMCNSFGFGGTNGSIIFCKV